MLSGPEIDKLRQSVVTAFDIHELDQFYLVRFDTSVLNKFSATTYENNVFNLIVSLNRRRPQIVRFILALRSELPEEEYIRSLEFKYNLGLYTYEGTSEREPVALESWISSNPLIKLEPFFNWLAEAKRCVCKVELQGERDSLCGTGFLVQPDLILTNYHVLGKLIEGSVSADDVKCRFDFAFNDQGKTYFDGNVFGLKQGDPIVAWSKYSEADLDPPESLDDVEWPADALDYCLARLAQPVGSMPFGPNAANATNGVRGWIKKPKVAPKLGKGGDIFMIQHPNGEAQSVALGLKKILGSDKRSRRLRYGISTLPGSSGSPGFNSDYEWICMHNTGDPKRRPKYNQGIPSVTIIENLETKGIVLGAQ